MIGPSLWSIHLSAPSHLRNVRLRNWIILRPFLVVLVAVISTFGESMAYSPVKSGYEKGETIATSEGTSGEMYMSRKK
jgi:hypothetical protein